RSKPTVRARMSTTRACEIDADERGFHTTVTASAKLGTVDFVAACRWSGELDDGRVAALRHLHIDLQSLNRETVHAVLRPNHEPHRFAGVDLNQDRIERKPAGRDLNFVNGLVRSSRAPGRKRRQQEHPTPSPAWHDVHTTTTCPVILGWIEQKYS